MDGDFWPGPRQKGGQRLKVNTRFLKRVPRAPEVQPPVQVA